MANLKIYQPHDPLFIAILQHDSDEIIQNLINSETIEKKENGLTPLLFACYLKNFRIMELLLNNNAQINARNSDGETALICAARQGDIDLVEFLLKHGAGKYVYDSAGLLAIDHAEQYGHTKIINKLK